LRLEIEPQAVPVGEATDREMGLLAQQAYRMLLAPGRVQITANAAPGLFYGVQTLVQQCLTHETLLLFLDERPQGLDPIERRRGTNKESRHVLGRGLQVSRLDRDGRRAL